MAEVIAELINKMRYSPHHISPSAYDTAWVAWLYPQAKEWLIENQHPDGSWGSSLVYYYDRIICTLAAVNAIAATSTNGHELKQVERGIRYLEQNLPCISQDVEETTAFELLLPKLIQIGSDLGLPLQRLESHLAPIMPLYHQKMALIPSSLVYSPQTVVAYSVEFLGFDEVDLDGLRQVRSENGSVHNSPSATAFAEVALGGTPEGKQYLDLLMTKYGGKVPGFTPLELFETIWSLHHLSLAVDLSALRPAIDPLIEWLLLSWRENGVGFSTAFVPDPDDTALGLRILQLLDITLDPRVLEAYEEETHFRCYPLERTGSVDVHLHIIHALRDLPHFRRKEELFAKAMAVLEKNLSRHVSLVDKWHISPYYSTAHIIVSLAGLRDDLIQNQINWLLKTQREDGRWTYYPAHPKAAIEETAHTLLALMSVYECGGDIPFQAIEQGYRYLENHYRSPEEIPPMWINKALYSPHHIVEAIILSAMVKYETLKTGDTVFVPNRVKTEAILGSD